MRRLATLPLGALLLGTAAGSAGAAGLRDFSSHAPPDLVMPNAGGRFVDPVFGTSVTRVTDASDGALCVSASAHWPAFNRDDTRLLLACDDQARLYRFEPSTGQLSRDGTLRGIDGPALEFEGAFWSALEPDVLFGLDGTRLWRVDVSRRGAAGATLVKDFSGLFSYPFTLAALEMAGDDQLFTFSSRDPGGGAPRDVVVYDRAADHTYLYDRGGAPVAGSRLDKLGRYCLVDGGTVNPGFRLWDFRRAPDAVDRFTPGSEDDKAGGELDLGRGLMVNSDGLDTGLVVRRWDNLHGVDNLLNIVQYERPDGTLNGSLADQVSLRSDDEGFAVGSTYGGDGSWAAFENEIYLAYTNGTGFVRLAHTRSTGGAASPTVRRFAEPRAVVDRLGHWIVFSSDLGSATRVDVMLLAIPPELYPEAQAQPDAGVPDAGVPDAGDAAVVGDAGKPGGGGGGCGCRAGGRAGDPWPCALAVVVLGWRRRRSRR